MSDINFVARIAAATRTVTFNEGGRGVTLSVAYGGRWGVRLYVAGHVFTVGTAFAPVGYSREV